VAKGGPLTKELLLSKSVADISKSLRANAVETPAIPPPIIATFAIKKPLKYLQKSQKLQLG